jgi:hypothetical protein
MATHVIRHGQGGHRWPSGNGQLAARWWLTLLALLVFSQASPARAEQTGCGGTVLCNGASIRLEGEGRAYDYTVDLPPGATNLVVSVSGNPAEGS